MLILTGPPAAGKSTIGLYLARSRERSAVIDCDVVRAMLVQPHHAPWQGEEGRRQHWLGAELSCQLALGFREAGCEVVIPDVLSPEITALYRDRLAPDTTNVVQLLPSWDESRRRFVARGPVLSDDEFAQLYQGQADFSEYDLRIDNSLLAVEEVAAQLQSWL